MASAEAGTMVSRSQFIHPPLIYWFPEYLYYTIIKPRCHPFFLEIKQP
jgi:hypothetical protein